MDDFDGGKSNGIGLEVKPPYTPRTASLIKYLTCESKLYPELLQMSISEKVNLVEGAGLTLDAEDDTQMLQAIKDIADARIALAAPLNGRIIGFGEINTNTGAMLFASPGITGSSLVPVGEAQVNIPTELDTNYAVVLGNNGIDTFGCLIGGSKTTTTFGVKSSGVDPIAFAMIRL